MGHKIRSVEAGSIADQLGIRAGDALVRMNGENVVDWVDYQALSSAENMRVTISRAGEETEYEFEKDDYEPLGLAFEDDMLGGVRGCANHCLFCFVDQLPADVRETMRVKDDDWRLSLMMGNYVTLTNVGEKELARIIARGASPLYISVHATEPSLREKLLGNENGGDIMQKLRALQAGGIQFHAQAVLCPGVNDGEALEQTMRDLGELYPACQSLALVPVGLTRCREGLASIAPYDMALARDVLARAERVRARFLRAHGTRFVFPADEFYLLAKQEFPADSEYEDYAQIDNGVGLCRQLIQEFDDAYEELPAKYKKGGKADKNIVIATGVSAQPVLKALVDAHPIAGVRVRALAVRNRYFGESVTVAGLVTGSDLVNQMKTVDADAFLITECMLRAEGDRFLDDMTLTQAREALSRPIIPVGRRGDELLQAILKFSMK